MGNVACGGSATEMNAWGVGQATMLKHKQQAGLELDFYAKSNNEMEISALHNRTNFCIKLKHLSNKDGISSLEK